MANVEAGLDSLSESNKECNRTRGENTGLTKSCEALKAELSEIKGEGAQTDRQIDRQTDRQTVVVLSSS